MPAIRTPHGGDATPNFSTNAIIERVQSQWLFTPGELQRAPSIMDGMKKDQEHSNRSKGVNFITQVGMLLKLPQLTLATASVYLHRFFMRHSMVDLPNRPGLHHYAVAATALFLATKVEENCRKMKELVVACCRVAQKQPNLVVDEQSKEYWKWRDTILHNEDLLLEALCFDLQLEQPYRILFEFLCYYGVQHEKTLRNVSWAYLNDANVTTMCLLFSTRLIAGSALYAAARFTGMKLPDDEHGRPWWEALGLDISEITNAVDVMADMYASSIVPRQGQKEVYRKTGEDGPNTTRSAISPDDGRSPSKSVGAESQGVKRDRDDDNIWADDGQNGRQSPSDTRRPSSVQSQEAITGVPRSPKRRRRDSSQASDGQPQRKPLLQDSQQTLRQDSNSQDIDDVQSRIDAIVNAGNAAAAPQTTNPPRPLSRRNSSRQHQWSGPLPRRRSSSTSNRQRPPSGHGNNVDEQRRSSSRRRPNVENENHQRSVSGRRPSHDGQGQLFPSERTTYDPNIAQGQETIAQNGMVNGGSPDHGGSEEGEL